MYHKCPATGATNPSSAKQVLRRLRAAPLSLAGTILLAGLAHMPAAFAQNDAWSNRSNGYGRYHVSNGAFVTNERPASSVGGGGKSGTHGTAAGAYYEK